MQRQFVNMLILVAVVVVVLQISATRAETDMRAVLMELESLLSEQPSTADDCVTLLARIRAWHQAKLKELSAVALTITHPSDGESVARRPFVQGSVSDRSAKVWVVVHPMETSTYWVQPRVSVRDDGSWKVMIHIGREGSVDVGKRFEIRAVANPEVKLSEGKQLRGWPAAQWMSDLIEVVRK